MNASGNVGLVSVIEDDSETEYEVHEAVFVNGRWGRKA